VPYGAVRLTEDGERRAVGIIRRHRLIETWLVREFDYTWDEVHDEAEVLEHALSDRMLEKVDARLGHPEVDPHGDLIPRHDGSVNRPAFVRLDGAPDGHEGRVLRVLDRDPLLLRAITACGIDVGTRVVVRPDGLELDGVTVEIPDGAPSAVWLTA
jgi:DtxR family Mn-dependent transcriptional regulator